MSIASVDAPPAPATLIRHGNTAVVVLDAALTEAAGLAPGTPLRVTVVDRQVVIEAAPAADERAARFQQAMHETATENAELFRRLAK